MHEELREIEIDSISVNPFQPRKQFANEELEELAASIISVGLIHPPVVRTIPNFSNRFELVSGERRLRAAQLANLKKIPVIVRPYDQNDSAQAALIENIQRVDLNAIEIAKALANLAEKFNLKQDELASRLGKKRSTVANYLRLLQLPKPIQDSVTDGKISMGHAKAILSLEKPVHQLHLHSRILENGLSVRQTEAEARNVLEGKTVEAKRKKSDIHLDDLVEKLQHKLGTKVSICGKGTRGRIQIDYFSLDDLDRILNVLKINE